MNQDEYNAIIYNKKPQSILWQDICQALEALDKWAIKEGWQLISEDVFASEVARYYLTPQGINVKITARK